jgi:hypothetical protein
LILSTLETACSLNVSFLQVYTKSPAELQQQAQLNAEIVISEEAEKDQQRQALQVFPRHIVIAYPPCL